VLRQLQELADLGIPQNANLGRRLGQPAQRFSYGLLDAMFQSRAMHLLDG